MRLLEDSLAEEVLSEKIKAGDIAVVDVGEDKKVKVLVGDQAEPDTMLSLDELSE